MVDGGHRRRDVPKDHEVGDRLGPEIRRRHEADGGLHRRLRVDLDDMTQGIIARVATQRGRRVTLRYLGVAKNHAWLRNRAAVINLPTLVNAGLTSRDGTWALA